MTQPISPLPFLTQIPDWRDPTRIHYPWDGLWTLILIGLIAGPPNILALTQWLTGHREVLRQHLHSLEGALDWPAAADVARPWIDAVRAQPAPFWALESLLQEFPMSSQEGLALMRLAEALLRVPDADTAIALTADQLGRADFAGHADSAMGRLSHAAVALSKRFLPDVDGAGGLSARLGGGLGGVLRRAVGFGLGVADELGEPRYWGNRPRATLGNSPVQAFMNSTRSFLSCSLSLSGSSTPFCETLKEPLVTSSR